MSAAEALATALADAVDELIATRGLQGAQVSARVGADVAVDVARGACSDGSPMRVGSRMPVYCLTKMLTAWAVLETCAAGGIDLETPAAAVLPRFGRNGKHGIRLRHLLTNCAGIDESVVWPVSIKFTSAADVYDAVCDAPTRASWDPERRAYYDYTNAYTVLGAWLERVQGRSYRTIVDELTGRLGIAPGIMPAPLSGGNPWAPRDWTPQAVLGTPTAEREALAVGLSGSPASGAVASAAELCALWSELTGDGIAIPPAIARRMRTSQRGRRYDEQLKRMCDYGFGVKTVLADYHSWGLPAEFTPNSYGHIGYGVALAAIVPERRLTYTVMLNGLEFPKDENFRMQRVLAATVCAHAPLVEAAAAELATA